MTGQPFADHRDIQSVLGAYALDAVEPDEAEVVARHLETCPRCRAEVQEHREVASMLGYAGQEAPAGLWDRITASMQEAPPALRLQRSEAVAPAIGLQVVRPTSGRSLRMRTVAVLGVAAAVAIALLGVQVSRLDHRTSTIGQEVASGSPTMSTVDQALSTPGARKVILTSDTTGQGLDAVILPNGTSYLYDTRLTPLASGQTYQLWGVSDAGTISYGLLGTAPTKVVSFQASSDIKALAVTAEVAGGVEHTTHAPVAAGAVPPV
jgi:hypothetical protein